MAIYNFSINLSKIPKDKIKKINKDGVVYENGAEYVNLTLFVNDTPDEYGNDIKVAISQTLEERNMKAPRIYLGPSNTIITTTYYSYDVFKNPYHNIKGYSKLNNPYYSERNIQDIVTDRKTVNSDGSTLNEKTSIIFTYVYNTALYPTEVYISRTGRNGVSKTIKHVYTYNQ